MPQILTAFASEVLVDGTKVDGLQAIEYRQVKTRQDVGAIGTDTRVAVYFGMRVVTGSLRVASNSPALDALLAGGALFTVSATLKHADSTLTLTFFDCVMDEKTFGLSLQQHGEAVYTFSARAVTEE